MVATHYEKINTHLFLHAPLGFVSFKPKKKQKKLWLQSTCFTTFLLTTCISVDLFLHRNWHYI